MTMPSSTAVLQVQDLSFAYPGQPSLVTRWSALLPAGITLLHGDTGTGKSTLLRLLAGTQVLDGRLMLVGVRLNVDPAAYRRMVFWHELGTDDFDQLTPRELAQAVCADPLEFDAVAWHRHAEGFGLVPHLHKALYMLSTGSRRKAMLAAALVSGCKLTLLDEPTGALDAPSVAYLVKALGTCPAAPDRAIVVASSERLDGLSPAAVIELPLR